MAHSSGCHVCWRDTGWWQVCRAGSHRGLVKSGGFTNLISQEQQNCASPEGEGTPQHVFNTIFTVHFLTYCLPKASPAL